MVTSLNPPSSSRISRSFSSVKRNLENNNLSLVKADKGDAVVILERSQYIEKVDQLLESAHAKEMKMDLKQYSGNIRRAIKAAPHVISCDPEQLFQMIYLPFSSTLWSGKTS